MDTKLIMLEGLPGSGKSTFSRIVTVQAERNGVPLRWYHEVARPHPTLFYHEACLTGEQYARLCEQQPQARDVWERVKEVRGAHVCFDLLELKREYWEEIGEAAYEAVRMFDTWEFPFEAYRDVALGKWKAFAAGQAASQDVALLDSSLFQYQIYGLLLMDVPEAQIKDFVRELCAIVEPLRPMMVYLYQQEVEAAIRSLFASRGEAWVQAIVERDLGTAYFQKRLAEGLSGVEAYVQLLEDYRRLADELLDELSCRKLAVEISGREWERYEGQVLDFFDLSRVNDPVVGEDWLAALPGVYENVALGIRLPVSVDKGVLYLHLGRSERSKKRLVPREIGEQEASFYVGDNSVKLFFRIEDTDGALCKLITGGMPLIDVWSETGNEYVRH